METSLSHRHPKAILHFFLPCAIQRAGAKSRRLSFAISQTRVAAIKKKKKHFQVHRGVIATPRGTSLHSLHIYWQEKAVANLFPSFLFPLHRAQSPGGGILHGQGKVMGGICSQEKKSLYVNEVLFLFSLRFLLFFFPGLKWQAHNQPALHIGHQENPAPMSCFLLCSHLPGAPSHGWQLFEECFPITKDCTKRSRLQACIFASTPKLPFLWFFFCTVLHRSIQPITSPRS